MLLKEANDYIGRIVLAEDPLKGSYYGVLENITKKIIYFAQIRILLVYKYPSQHNSIFFKKTQVERRPFQYGEIQSFGLGDVTPHATTRDLYEFNQKAYDASLSVALTAAEYYEKNPEAWKIIRRHAEEFSNAKLV